MAYRFYCSRAMALLMSLGLSACVSMPAQRGADAARQLTSTRLSTTASMWLQSENAKWQALLAEPLDADACVRLALLLSPRMQVLYAELGFASADIYDASRLSNPTLGYTRLTGSEGDRRATWSLAQNFTELLFVHYRLKQSRSELQQTQLRVAQSVLNLEATVREAFYRHAAATLQQQMHAGVTRLATLSTQHAEQLYAAGNISELQLTRERAFAVEAMLAKQQTEDELAATRADLLTLLGLKQAQEPSTSPTPTWVTTLPLPMPLGFTAAQLMTHAQQQRLDWRLVNERIAALTEAQRHSGRWGWVNDGDLTVERETESGRPTLSGAGASVSLPVFNQGSGKALRARSALETESAQRMQLENELHNDVYRYVAQLQRAEQAVALYRQQLLPLREKIVTLSQQQHNFMLIGTPELLLAKHDELTAYRQYLLSIRDYWLTYTQLQRVVGGRLPSLADQNESAMPAIEVGIDGQWLAPLKESDSPPKSAEQSSSVSTETSATPPHSAHDHGHDAGHGDPIP